MSVVRHPPGRSARKREWPLAVASKNVDGTLPFRRIKWPSWPSARDVDAGFCVGEVGLLTWSGRLKVGGDPGFMVRYQKSDIGSIYGAFFAGQMRYLRPVTMMIAN